MDRQIRLLLVVVLVLSFVSFVSGCATLMGHSEPEIDTDIAENTRLTVGEFTDEVKRELDDVEFVFQPESLRQRRLSGGWNGEGRLEVVLAEVCDAGVDVSRDRLPNGRWRYTLSCEEVAAPAVAAAPAPLATTPEPAAAPEASPPVTAPADTALAGSAQVTSEDGAADVDSSTPTDPTVAGSPPEPGAGGAEPATPSGGDGTAAASPSDGAAPEPAPAPAPAAATRNIIRPGYLIYRPSGAESRASLDRRQTYQLNVADGDVDAGDAPAYASDMVEADAEIRMVANGQGGFNFGVRPTNETVGDYGVLLDRTLYVRAEWAKQIIGSDGPFWVGSDLLRSRGQWIWQQLREPPADRVQP